MFFYAEPDNNTGSQNPIVIEGWLMLSLTSSKDSLSFDSACIGASSQATFVLSAGSASNIVSQETVTLVDDTDQFSFSPSTFTMIPGVTNQLITVTFSPTSWGVKTGTIIVTSAGGSTKTINLSAVCVADPLIITSSVGTIDFGSGYVAETSSATFTVSAGGRVQDIVIMSDDSDQFDFSPSSFSMTGSNQTQTVTVYFTPTNNGSKIGVLTLSASGGDVAHVALNGSGVYHPLVLTSSVSSIDFNNIAVNSSASTTFTVSAGGVGGTETVTVTDDSTQFDYSPSSFTLTGGGSSQTVTAIFSPTSLGVKTGNITLSATSGSTKVISLQGTGGDPYSGSVTLLLKGEGTNNSTNIIDSSINASTVTVSGNTAISTAQSKYGSSSIYFDGNADYITVPSSQNYNIGSGSFTVEMWIRPGTGISTGQQRHLFGKRANGAVYKWMLSFLTYNFATSKYSLAFYASFDGVSWGISNANIDNYTISPNTWTHLAYVRNGNNWYVYINGICYYLGYYTGTVSFDSSAFSIGSTSIVSPTTNGYSGYIDDFRFTKGVARYQNSAPEELPYTAATDPYYSNVSALLNAKTLTPSIDSGPNTLSCIMNGTRGAVSNSSFGKFDGGMYFSGIDSFIHLGTQNSSSLFDFGSGSFTIEAWINPNSTAASKTIYGNYGRTLANGLRNGAHLLRLNAGKLDFYVYPSGSGAAPLVSNSTIQTGVWTHVALVRSGSTTSMFINGALDATTKTGYTLTSDPSHPPTVGAFWQAGSIEATSYFSGTMDDLRITKGIARYTPDFTPPDSL